MAELKLCIGTKKGKTVKKEIKEDEAPPDTMEGFAHRLNHQIAGYGKKLESPSSDQVIVLAVDSASPGRLSIIYYRSLSRSGFLHRIEEWHSTCLWKHRYRKIDQPVDSTGKFKRVTIPFIGAPTPNDIIETAYGNNADDKLIKSSIKRLLPCIIDGQPLPRDIVQSAVRRVSNRIALAGWEWEKGLTITCALFKKFNQKENYQMALEPDRYSRDYLYGRLLAVAESIEQWALSEANESRPTNALRLMQKFAERPFSTWRTLELSLTPYKVRLGSKLISRQKILDEIMSAFSPDDFTNDRPLSGEYLLGYHCQRESLYKKTTADNPNTEIE